MSMQQLNPVVVGNVIARFRIEKGLTQEVLSGLSDIGRTHLSAIERGERKPTLETLYRISNALGISMSTIVIAIEQELEKQKRCAIQQRPPLSRLRGQLPSRGAFFGAVQPT